MIYLACYLGSCLFAYLDFRFGKADKRLGIVFMFLAIMLPCVLAGIRDSHIGTDVNVYVSPVIQEMREDHLGLGQLLYSEIFIGETNGIFFTIILYLCSQFKNGLMIALFLIQLFCLLPVYAVIKKQKFSNGLKSIALYSYYCFFYHLDLNLMKQCIAISIVFLGFGLIKKKKTFKFVLLVIFTMLLVHKSAVLGLLICVVYHLSIDKKELFFYEKIKISLRLENKSDRRKKNLLYCLIIGAIIIALMNIRNILRVLVLFKHSYVYQLSHMQDFHIKYSNLLIMLLILAPVLLLKRKEIWHDIRYRFYTYIVIISTVLYQFVGTSPALYRVSLYTMIFVILAIPYYINLFKKNDKYLMGIYYVFVVSANFVFDVVINSYAGVYPYISAI